MIAKGDIFATYAEFQSALKQYCLETNQEFVVAKSEKNTKQEDIKWPFKLKELKCAHHRRTKCCACIRINLKKAGIHKNKYMIVTMSTQHTDACPYMARNSFKCDSDGYTSCSQLSPSKFENDMNNNDTKSAMTVNEMFNDYYSKVLAEPKYLGLRDYLFFIFISWSNAATC